MSDRRTPNTTDSSPLTVAARFRGPPNSGNGGYVCGVVAARLTGGNHALPDHLAAEVTLRSPVPLDAPMTVLRDEGGVHVMAGDALIAEATLTRFEMEVPAPPSWDAAQDAASRSASFIEGPGGRTGMHPICFCCGAELAASEGLRVFAGPVAAEDGFDGVAAAWQPDPSFGDADGWLPAEYIWTALDCPGQGAFLAAGIRTGLLGRMVARIERPVSASERNIVIGWRLGIEGRKHYAGTAIYNARGELCASAKATWIGR
jgi:hypothetical protein